MNMMLLFNRLNKRENDLIQKPVTPDGFWVETRQKAMSCDQLKECLETQRAMEERAAKISKNEGYTAVRYRLMSDGFSGAILFQSKP